MRFAPCLALLAAPAFAEAPDRPDLMTFAQGALPVVISERAEALRVGADLAIAMIDGSPQKFGAVRKPATAADVIEIVFALPAPTMFDRFAVPRIEETPSPSQTFFSDVEVLGGAAPEGPFVPLAAGTLAVGEMAELTMAPEPQAVTHVLLRLSGGVDVQRDATFFEFSELIGNGVQQEAPLATGFGGVWGGRGVKLELAQDGAVVSGCYDAGGMLDGTVSGNVLRAVGQDPAGIASHFILVADPAGGFRGLRSSNGAPFSVYDGSQSSRAPTCTAPPAPALGCGSIVHGIGFEYDSAAIRPGAEALLADLHRGLQSAGGTITIVGHSSAEGSAEYNRDLSQRRAQSVADALVALGLPAGQVAASGRGEDMPIATNDNEAGRSLNRRVEITCG